MKIDPVETEVSPVAQNYLLALYMMQEERGPVTLSRLAEELAASPATEHLGTSLASVAGMIRRMKRDGLIDILGNKEIIFTHEGQRSAEAVMRRHQLAERLLVDVLGLELTQVHAEAHRLEHAISPKVEERLNERLGNPPTCPFGHPIPGSGYEPPSSTIQLDKAEPGTPMVIERIPEDDPKLIGYLVDKGVLPGTIVKVTDIAPFRGTLTMEVNSQEVVIGIQVAIRILVRPDLFP
ncbi:metal-dependent transcriptional regulator [Dehalococcoidia bacterium]|nr:metal-dependent transcriptional regulator [Dehalococcoidia bacterium]